MTPDYPRIGSDAYEMMHGSARRTDPSTSHTAALKVDAKGQRATIMRILHIAAEERSQHPCVSVIPPGMTADELDQKIGWRVTTAGRRLSELHNMVPPLVEPCGKRYTRSGRPARVWRVTS